MAKDRARRRAERFWVKGSDLNIIKKADWVREELTKAYWSAENGRGSPEHLEAALEDASRAIARLPCKCGKVAWPVVAKPKRGSFEWWDDPGAYFACRGCGAYLTDADSYPIMRGPNCDYPFGGELPPPKAERQRIVDDAIRIAREKRERPEDDRQ